MKYAGFQVAYIVWGELTNDMDLRKQKGRLLNY